MLKVIFNIKNLERLTDEEISQLIAENELYQRIDSAIKALMIKFAKLAATSIEHVAK